MPWAITDQVSTDQIEGGIEITDVQYAAAIEAMVSGKLVIVEDGAMEFADPPVEDVDDPPVVEDGK